MAGRKLVEPSLGELTRLYYDVYLPERRGRSALTLGEFIGQARFLAWELSLLPKGDQ